MKVVLQIVLVSLALVPVLGVVFALSYWLGRRPDSRVLAMLEEKRSPEATAHDLCMVRQGFLEEPGVSQIAGNQMNIWTLTGRTFQLPLSDLQLNKVRRNNWLGRYPWWGKTILYLSAAGQDEIAVGFDNADPWLNKLNPARIE